MNGSLPTAGQLVCIADNILDVSSCHGSLFQARKGMRMQEEGKPVQNKTRPLDIITSNASAAAPLKKSSLFPLGFSRHCKMTTL